MNPLERWLTELKRRKVFRVGMIYAAAALALGEGIDVLLAPLGAPPWVQTAFAALAVAGFPVALVLAWVYELTPAGPRRTEAEDPGASPGRRGRLSTLLEAALLVAILGVGVWVLAFARADIAATGEGGSGGNFSPSRPPAEASVAVLPFENFSPDPENRYFADGLAEQLLDELGRLGSVKVAGRTSSFAFRDSAVGVAEIGRALNVATVVDGSVRRSAERIRISVRLIRASDGYNLWSATFDEELEDIFAIQDAVAREIVRELRGRLLPEDSVRLDVARARSLDAFDAYLQGIDQLRNRSPVSLRRAMDRFEQAIALDPGYAKAHAGLAQTYYHLPNFDATVSAAVYARLAKQHARRALELDPRSAEAHAVLGGVLYQMDLDFAAAERELRAAIRLNPNHAVAHQWLAESLIVQGRYEEALEPIERAIELDPASPMATEVRMMIDFHAGRLEEARALSEAVTARFPDFFWTRAHLTFLLLRLGEEEQAVREWRRAAHTHHAEDSAAAEHMARGIPLIVAARRDADGRADAAAFWGDPAILPHWRLIALVTLGDVAGAVEILKDMRARRDPLFAWAGVAVGLADPGLDLREYLEVLEEAGVTPAAGRD
jgi:TolB-like protein/Tfp pilus assembly protein PilF